MGRRRFSWGQEQRDRVADRNVVAFRGGDRAQRARPRGLHLDGRLVRFDLHERLALGNLVALALQPPDELARVLSHAERRHHDLSCDEL
jgi:hypothetical protein